MKTSKNKFFKLLGKAVRPIEWQREALTAMFRVIRPDGVIFYNHKWRVQGGVMQGDTYLLLLQK